MDISRKVAAGGAAGAATIVLVWVVSLFGLEVPDYVAQALTVLATAATGYLVPERGGRHEA